MENYAAAFLNDLNLAPIARKMLEEQNRATHHIASSTEYTTADAANVIDAFYDIEKADYPREKGPMKAVQNIQEQVSKEPAEMLFSLFSLFIAVISLVVTICWMCSSYNPFYTEKEPNHLTTIIPLFMLLGPELVAKALAVTTTSPRNDSVCFGFGLLGYMFSLLTTAFTGLSEILPKPEIDSKVLDLRSGQGRVNKSFLLSRVLRDLESQYVPSTGGLVIEVLHAVAPAEPLSSLQGICINYRTFLVSVAQLIMACGYGFLSHGDCSVMCIFTTALFALHALTHLPAWTTQKFSARKDNGKNATHALLRGNGHRHVFVIKNTHREAWNLEDLAAPGLPTYNYAQTRELPIIMAVFLIFLFLTMLATQLSYFGSITMILIIFYGNVGNLLIAGLPRAPWAHGIALEPVETIQDESKVMPALQSFEEKYPGYGAPMVKEFFPGGLSEDEKKWWDERKQVHV
jgi:hypothetical protein